MRLYKLKATVSSVTVIAAKDEQGALNLANGDCFGSIMEDIVIKIKQNDKIQFSILDEIKEAQDIPMGWMTYHSPHGVDSGETIENILEENDTSFNEEIRLFKELATALGWENIYKDTRIHNPLAFSGRSPSEGHGRVPDYTRDLNAIQAEWEKLSSEGKWTFRTALNKITNNSECASAKDRVRALIEVYKK